MAYPLICELELVIQIRGINLGLAFYSPNSMSNFELSLKLYLQIFVRESAPWGLPYIGLETLVQRILIPNNLHNANHKLRIQS